MATKVSESTGYTSNLEMSLLGYAIAVILVILLLPLLPVIVLVWLVWRALVGGDERERSFQEWRHDRGRPPSGS